MCTEMSESDKRMMGYFRVILFVVLSDNIVDKREVKRTVKRRIMQGAITLGYTGVDR